MLRFISHLFFIFLFLSYSSHAQLETVGVEEAGDLIPEVKEEDSDRKLVNPTEDPIHQELALIAVQSQIGTAVLKKRIEEANTDSFVTTKDDLQEMVDEFSQYASLVDSLSHRYMESSIEKGATPTTPENHSESQEASSHCYIVEGELSASCRGQVYQAEDEQSFIRPVSPEVAQMENIQAEVQGIVSENEDRRPIGIKPDDSRPKRNLVIISMRDGFKEKRKHLEDLLEKGLVDEISLKGIAFVKKNFETYKKTMGDYLKVISDANNHGKCEIPAGSIEVNCFGTRYTLKNTSPIGQQISKGSTKHNLNRGAADFHYSEEVERNSQGNRESISQ